MLVAWIQSVLNTAFGMLKYSQKPTSHQNLYTTLLADISKQQWLVILQKEKRGRSFLSLHGTLK